MTAHAWNQKEQRWGTGFPSPEVSTARLLAGDQVLDTALWSEFLGLCQVELDEMPFCESGAVEYWQFYEAQPNGFFAQPEEFNQAFPASAVGGQRSGPPPPSSSHTSLSAIGPAL